MKFVFKLKPTPILIISLLIICIGVYVIIGAHGEAGAGLGILFTVLILFITLVVLFIERFFITSQNFLSYKIWLTEILLLAIIPIYIFTENYIPPTPREYRNQLTFERTDLSNEFFEIKQVIEDRADSVKWPFSHHLKENAHIETEFLFGYFDSTKTKAAFVVIMSAPVNYFISSSDKEIGYNGAAFTAMKDSVGVWKLNYDQVGSTLWGAWGKKGVIKYYKRTYLREIQQIEIGEQKYNYDDIRVFETFKFDPVYFDKRKLK